MAVTNPPAWLSDMRASAERAKAAEHAANTHPENREAAEAARRVVAAMHDRLDADAVLWLLEVLEGSVLGSRNTLLLRDYQAGPKRAHDGASTIVDDAG